LKIKIFSAEIDTKKVSVAFREDRIMSTEEQARERMAQQRQHSEQLQESMLRRVEAESAQLGDLSTEEQARQEMVQQRHQSQHLQESMLSRSETEVGMPNDTGESPQGQQS